MKNWKDKVLGIFAIIGVMALLMGNYLQKPKISVGITQNENGRYQISAGGDNKLSRYIYLIDTRTGEVWYERGNVWVKNIPALK